MGSHFSAPVKLRSERTNRGVLAMLLVVGVLAAITITGTGIASATSSLTGYYAPRIAHGGVDINNDGLVNGTDDSTNFMPNTNLIDGQLSCDAWDDAGEVDVNDFKAGSDTDIDGDDDCVVRGWVGYSGTVSTETYLWIVDGYFAYSSSDYDEDARTVITDGFLMPSVYDDDAASFDFTAAVFTGMDLVWRVKSGEVDLNWDGTLDDNGNDYAGPGVDIASGLVDVNGVGGVTSSDDCYTGCFFGRNVLNGYVQDNTPTNRFTGSTGATGPTGPAGANGVSGRVAVTESSSTNSLNKSKSALCTGTTKVLGGGYSLTGSAATLAHLTVVANGPISGGWRVRVLEATPTTGSWSVTVNVICATA